MQVEVPFGKVAWKEFRTIVPIGSPEDKNTETLVSKMDSFIWSKLESDLKARGFTKGSRALAYFENALDYQIREQIVYIARALQKGKIPRILRFDVDTSRAREVDVEED